jgi:hypothetical protein
VGGGMDMAHSKCLYFLKVHIANGRGAFFFSVGQPGSGTHCSKNLANDA